MPVVVLRIGHRPERDKRITTHIGLVARAFGAKGMILAARDSGVVSSIMDVARRWGEGFQVSQGVSWREEVLAFQRAGGKVVHLTMYGTNLPDVIEEIRPLEDIMVVVGAEKVPSEIYTLADWNVAVGNQPHSEVAALAVFLDRLACGTELEARFQGDVEIVPMARGKKVVQRQGPRS